jgi:hypothetical protein
LRATLITLAYELSYEAAPPGATVTRFKPIVTMCDRCTGG